MNENQKPANTNTLRCHLKPKRIAPCGRLYDQTEKLLAFVDENRMGDALAVAHAAQYMLDEISEPSETDTKNAVCLAMRFLAVGGCNPAYSYMDWADAVSHFPVDIDWEVLLALDDEVFANSLDRMAQYKHETYIDQEHEEAPNTILHDILEAAKGDPTMGFYTWTLANKTPVKNKRGDFKANCVAPYGGYSAILTPDNKLIKEDYYEGYGIWDDRDIFELLADWNKADIPDLIASGVMKDAWCNDVYAPIALAWAQGDLATAEKLADATGTPCAKEDVHRLIGIWLNSMSDKLKYPIKIVSLKSRCPDYASLPASVQTQ